MEFWGPIDSSYDHSNQDRRADYGCWINVVQYKQSQRLLFQIRVILLKGCLSFEYANWYVGRSYLTGWGKNPKDYCAMTRGACAVISSAF